MIVDVGVSVVRMIGDEVPKVRSLADDGTMLAEGFAERCRSEIAGVGVNVAKKIPELRQW